MKWYVDKQLTDRASNGTMQIFIDDLAEVENFPRNLVIQHLASISDNLTIQYLEYIMDELHDQSPDFHNRLAIAYLQKIKLDGITKGSAGQSGSTGTHLLFLYSDFVRRKDLDKKKTAAILGRFYLLPGRKDLISTSDGWYVRKSGSGGATTDFWIS